ncbi:hypothetical protein PIB30_004549 [Stylosanthes scabra]|uniref:Aminotransferase-like plant mobile domain-containing protein n=1 Tax=Stylosanthes scabra TaxID=79078 RepID=A0ABU6Y5G2_9FABA|nr:hypothetical protein [Stylosanthes scabra]
MPFLTPVLTAPSFPLSRRWVNWVLQDKEHRRWTLRHYRQMLDNITDDSFLRTPYDEHRLGPNVVPDHIYTHMDLWNAPSPLIAFECVEWCPTDRVMRQFGLAQSFPTEPRSLANKHNECLIKNKGNMRMRMSPMNSQNNLSRNAISHIVHRLPSRFLHKKTIKKPCSHLMEARHNLPHSQKVQVFNAVYNSANDFEMGQRNQTMLGRLSVDSHFHASAASAASTHSVARQSFDSSRSLNVRGIGDDGVRRANTAAGIYLNFNASSIQEDEEAARYTRYRDTNRLNTDDGDEGEDEDEDEDEEEDYLVTDGGDVDTKASNCAGDASASAAAASIPKLAGKRYNLRTEHSRRSPNRFTPSGWSTKALKQGASGVVKNVSNLFGKKK